MSSGGTLAGQVAVVTGGASGIGRALAERLHAEGARVAVVDRNGGAAAATAGAIDGALPIGADVADETAVTALVEQVEVELGPIDVYCSNAGVSLGVGLGGDKEWEESWAVHALAHLYAARAVLPGMVERGSGHFVVTASAAGLLMLMRSAPYTVTKHASVALAEWLAVEYGGKGVGIHCVAPQGVRTPMVDADPVAEAEVGASAPIIEPAAVAEAAVAALASGTFLVLPHTEVRAYEQAKVADRDRWLTGMRRLAAKLQAQP